MHLEFRPADVADLWAVEAGQTAAWVTPETLFPAAAGDLPRFRELWTYKLRPERIAALLGRGDPEILHIEATHTQDLDFLRRASGIRALAINWNTKVDDLSFLADMTGLTVLSLHDLKRVRNLGPLASLAGLESLQFAGGTWSTAVVETLKPLARLPNLKDLRFASIAIKNGSLAPLAELPRLERLSLPNNGATMEEFARLSARLPHVSCEMFQPYSRLDGIVPPVGTDPVRALDEIGDDTVMVTGRGGPLLRARTDREKLLKYCERFEAARR